MQSGIKTNAIVLREISLRDSDKILVCLSEDLGKISISARGVRNPKNKNIAASHFLTYAQYVLYPARDMYRLSQGSVIETFFHVREDIVKLTYAAHFAQILIDCIHENEPASKELKLLLNVLYYIMKDKNNIEYLACVFEFRLMRILGLMPYIESKDDSGEFYLSCKEGKISNDRCQDGMLLPINSERIVYDIFHLSLKDVLNMKVDENISKKLKKISLRYIEYHLEKRYKKLDYINLL